MASQRSWRRKKVGSKGGNVPLAVLLDADALLEFRGDLPHGARRRRLRAPPPARLPPGQKERAGARCR